MSKRDLAKSKNADCRYAKASEEQMKLKGWYEDTVEWVNEIVFMER